MEPRNLLQLEQQRVQSSLISLEQVQENLQSQVQINREDFQQEPKLKNKDQETLPHDSVYVQEGQLEKNKPQGCRVINYPNGDIYEGQIENGQRQGKGILKYKNGQIFEGE